MPSGSFCPLQRAAPAQTASSPGLELRGGCETVLLVEDEAPVREMVRLCLRSKGYCVLEAANGVEALALWQQQSSQIDLLFTDMRMPEGINGMELAERLKAEKSTLKVIISSGYSLEISQHGAPADRAITFLPKPYPLETLAKAVRKSLDGD
jgi:two-component system cell cycle sensor histidine kinase/response regulator CckA